GGGAVGCATHAPPPGRGRAGRAAGPAPGGPKGRGGGPGRGWWGKKIAPPPRRGGARRWRQISSMTVQASGAVTPLTVTTPGLTIPAFSRAMPASVGPSCCVWSMLMLVMTVTRGRRQTLVESSRPPRPTSTTAACTPAPRGGAQQPHRGGAPKKRGSRRGPLPPARAAHFSQQPRQSPRRDRLSIDLNAFLDRAEVRRGEQAGPVAGALEDGGEH